MTCRLLFSIVLGLFIGVSAQSQDAAKKALEDGKEKLQAQDYTAAIAKFNEAIELRSGDFAEAHLQLGLAYYYSDKFTEAGSELDTAAEQDPNNAMIERYIAEVALFEPDYQKALNAFEAYMDALPPGVPEHFAALKRVSKLRLLAVGTYQAGLADHNLELLSKPKPKYPDSVKANITGDVIVEAVFTADGEVVNARVVQSLGKEFDEDALRLLVNMPFNVAVKGGKPVSQKQKLKMHYQKVFG